MVSNVINRVVDEIRDTLLTLVLTVTSEGDCDLEPVSVAHSFVTPVSLSSRHKNLKDQLKLRIQASNVAGPEDVRGGIRSAETRGLVSGPLFLNFRPGQSGFSHGKQGGSSGLICLAVNHGNPGNCCSCR